MTKTTQVAFDRAFDETKTVMPAEVARGLYVRNAPSLRALKLMHLMIAKAGGRMADDVRHEARLADVRSIDGMTHHDRKTLQQLFEELRSTVLTYDNKTDMRITIGGFLDEAIIDYINSDKNDDGMLITWYFGRTFREMAAKSDHWAILDRQTVFQLSSRYSILLFQYIASLAELEKINSRAFDIEALRALFAIPKGKLERFADLNRRVLQPAILEINQLSRLTLTVDFQKVGKTITSVIVSWKSKHDLTATKRELSNHSMGITPQQKADCQVIPNS